MSAAGVAPTAVVAGRPSRDIGITLTVAALWLLLALFVVYPLVMLFARMLGMLGGRGSVDFGALLALLTDRNQLRAFWNSLLLAFLVGTVGTLAGFLFAFTATRCRLPRAAVTAIDASVLLPLVSPPFTTAIAMIFSFGPRGLVTYGVFGIKGFSVYGLGATLFSEALTYFPIAYLTLRPILAGIDSNIETMAQSLGASRARVFRTVTLPLCVPGIANAFLLLFAASLADFATPLILAGNSFPVLPTQAYLQITGLFDFKGGAVLSLILLLPAAAVFLLQRHWVGKRVYVTVTGKVGQRSRTRAIAPWAGGLLVAACFAVAAIIVYFYALLVIASLVVAFGANNGFTWRHYHVI